MNKNDVTINYAFQEYISEKELNERGIKEVSKILTYEEPRWTLKDTASALKIIKESDSNLYEMILSYIKEQHLPSENVLYLDFGKSLHYDDEYSKETLSDNRFIVRYSHDNDEGNLIDGGDEIIINDEKIVSLFNGMIEEHVKENIQKYNEYNKPFTPSEYVLSKLKEKGIEVVTDKEEFDRILESQNILQKLEPHSTEEKNPLFLVNKNELKAFAQKIDDWKAGNLKPTEVISEFSTSTVLQAINIPANKVSVTQDVLHKINKLETVKVGKSYGHDIDIATIKKIPEFLADPVMVFGSASTPGSYVIMSETIDKKNRTIMVAMEINKQNANVIVNNITSAYGRNDNNFFIEQIKLGNLVYQNKQKSLEWTNERGLPLPPQMSTQGSLNVIQKEDIVKQKTPNFSFSERHFAFTENQQEFLRELGFTNSVDGDNSVLDWKMSKTIPETNKIIYFETGADKGRVNCFACYEIDESKDNVIRTDLLRRYAEEKNAFEGFLTSISFNDRQNNFIVPYEKLGKVLSDEILEKLTDYIDDKAPKISRENFSNDIIDVAFKNKVRNLPARFISEDIYSSGINSIGKKLTFKVYKEVLKIAGVPVDDKKHYLLKIQTDNNYEYVHNKDYPRLYEAKWNRIKQAYTDEVELNLNSFNSKTIGNIQYIAANNYNYPNPPAQTMTLSDGTTYGFAHNGKIYLNPDVLSAEVAMHEYTHLWDNLTRKDNPELWNKGLQIFKGTSLWNEVVNDENYQDIKDDENLVLSECHARITGKVAEAVLNRIAEQDGTAKQAEMIDWDKETINFIFDNYRDIFAKNGFETVAEFTSATMKELFNPVEHQKRDISINSSALKDSWIWKDYDDFSGHLESPDGKSYFSYDWTTKEYKITSDSGWDSFIDADPTRDTSLSAFKDYAQDYIKNNIAKHKDIVFERKYIDTEKWLEEEEKEMIKTESLADKYNRMENLFEGKMSHLGSGDGETFKELCKWVEEEFPEKDSEGVLLEATSRMIEENLDFGEFNYQAFDDVYGFGEGAEWRLDFSDFVAKELLSGEIITLSDAQSLIWEKAEKEFKALRENPQYKNEIEIMDTINGAFLVSKKYNEIVEKDLNDYAKFEKIENIQKALENIKKTYTEDSHDIRNDYGTGIFGADLETLIKGNDAVIYGEKSLDFVRPDRISLELGIEDDIPFNDLIRGYFVFDSEDLKVPRHIEHWDYMKVFDSDYDAAQQWCRETGGKLLENGKDIWISDEKLEHYCYPDTPENRKILKEYLLPQPLEFNWDNFTEEQFNAVKEEITSGTIKEDYKGQVYVGSVCAEFTITDKESNWVDYNNYILGEKGEGEISGIPYSYKAGKQIVMNTFSENSYEDFKIVIKNVLMQDFGKDSHLKQEAMRQTINWATINEKNKDAAIALLNEKEGISEEELKHLKEQINLDTSIENNIKEYFRREYAETYPNSGKFKVTIENQSYPIDKDELDYIANSDEWSSVEDRLNDVIDRRFEEEIEQKENDILSDVKEYIAKETNGNLILKDSELREVLFSEELVQIYAPKEDFLANQPEEVKAALIKAGIARSELYNNVESIPVSEEARNTMVSASYAGQGGITQKAFADNGIEIDLATANALENCFSQIEAITKYTADGHDLFHKGNGIDTISEHTIEYSETNKAWFVHEKNWLALSAIKGNEAEPDDYMEKASRVGDRNWALSCEELVKYVYQEIKEDGEMEKEFPDTFKKLEKLNEYLEAERIKENGVQRRKEDYFASIKVSKENFRDVFNEVIKLPKFKDKPLEAARWCFSKVPKENKSKVVQWFSNLGCKTKKDTDKLFNKWNRENNPKPNVNKSKKNDKDDWSISY